MGDTDDRPEVPPGGCRCSPFTSPWPQRTPSQMLACAAGHGRGLAKYQFLLVLSKSLLCVDQSFCVALFHVPGFFLVLAEVVVILSSAWSKFPLHPPGSVVGTVVGLVCPGWWAVPVAPVSTSCFCWSGGGSGCVRSRVVPLPLSWLFGSG